MPQAASTRGWREHESLVMLDDVWLIARALLAAAISTDAFHTVRVQLGENRGHDDSAGMTKMQVPLDCPFVRIAP